MKKIVEEVDTEGLEALIGENVLIFAANYIYTGKLIGVNTEDILLENPSIVYETGAWNTTSYTDSQKLHTPKWYIRINAVESYGLAK